MYLSPVNYKSSLITQMNQKNNSNIANLSTSVVMTPYTSLDDINKEFNKKRNKKIIKAVSITAGALLMVLAFFKRKAIASFIQKFRKKPATAKQIKEIIKLPEPHFTTTQEQNPAKFAQEKAEYIKSIWDEFIFVNPPFKPVDKQKNLLGLKALQKYGSLDDLRNLPLDYELSKDSDIMKEYAKFVARVGETKDTITLRAKLDRRHLKIYSQEALEEILKALEKIMVHDAPPNHWVNYDVMGFKELEYCSKLDNSVISQAAKNIMDRIILDNPWMRK